MLTVAAEPAAATAPVPPIEPVEPALTDSRYVDYKIIRRNGAVVGFAPNKIAIAVTKAFIAVQGGQAAASARIRELVETITSQVVNALIRRQPNGGTFHIEDVQDQVELALMRSGEHEVARAYVLYREKRAQERAAQKAAGVPDIQLHVIEDGQRKPLDTARLAALVTDACAGLENVRAEPIMQTVLRDLYDGVPMAEVEKALVLAARSMIEQDPAYAFVTARLLLNSIRHEVLGEAVTQAQMGERYAEYFPAFIKKGSDAELLDERLMQYDLDKLGKALDASRDLNFQYLGLQTLYDRYFLHIQERRIELPQAFFMRVAMGLAINEINRE
ncbi:MAG TPA: ATP cone domain-containing protein, partial [Thiobacillaceae bacterium]